MQQLRGESEHGNRQLHLDDVFAARCSAAASSAVLHVAFEKHAGFEQEGAEKTE